LPAGALADIADRRRMLIAAQIVGLLAAAALAVLTWQGLTTPVILLGVTLLLGTAAALSAPAFQAIVPELVDRASLPEAVALNSLGVNISRAIGPALGGVVVALAGPAAVFTLNALSVLAVLAVLANWKRSAAVLTLPPEHFLDALKAGYRYARQSPALRVVLVRAVGFFIFGSALWAMLPLVARRELGLDAVGYGALLACMGAGAVLGAVLLKWLRGHVAPNALSLASTLLFAMAGLALALAKSVWIAGPVMVMAGLAWIGMLTSLNVAAQLASPSWVKARALAVYLVAFQGAMTGGSILWGVLAARTDVTTALIVAATGQALAVVLAFRWRLPTDRAVDLTPSHHWADPTPATEPGADRGPVLIEIEYRVAPNRVAAFVAALRSFKAVRRRDGAIRWDVWEDAAEPGRIIETFVVESWLEHLRQHARVTEADRIEQDALNAFHIGDDPPRVRHLLTPSR
ncbi:MAG: transporter, partial [Brevundimonas sp.]|nr:transporter [Brevundimonas sp.]